MKELEKPKVRTREELERYFLGAGERPDSETLHKLEKVLQIVDQFGSEEQFTEYLKQNK